MVLAQGEVGPSFFVNTYPFFAPLHHHVRGGGGLCCLTTNWRILREADTDNKWKWDRPWGGWWTGMGRNRTMTERQKRLVVCQSGNGIDPFLYTENLTSSLNKYCFQPPPPIPQLFGHKDMLFWGVFHLFLEFFFELKILGGVGLQSWNWSRLCLTSNPVYESLWLLLLLNNIYHRTTFRSQSSW